MKNYRIMRYGKNTYAIQQFRPWTFLGIPVGPSQWRWIKEYMGIRYFSSIESAKQYILNMIERDRAANEGWKPVDEYSVTED